MNIPIPRFMVRAADAFIEWANVTIWERAGRFELRRIDLLLVTFFFVCVGYYYWSAGPMGALQGGAMYLALAALSLWVF
jgi:hypothetical protein